MSKEQFALAPGGTYYFDLSGENIPGTANDALPTVQCTMFPLPTPGQWTPTSSHLRWQPPRSMHSRINMPASLFMADHAVTHTVSWDNLNTKSLIFGKVTSPAAWNIPLRAPSGEVTIQAMIQTRHAPKQRMGQMLNKNSGYIKNWGKMESWGQDTSPLNAIEPCGSRVYHSARKFADASYACTPIRSSVSAPS